MIWNLFSKNRRQENARVFKPTVEPLEDRNLLSGFQSFLQTNDIIGAANLQLGSNTKEVVLVNADTTPGQDALVAFDPLTGQEFARYSHAVGSFEGWTDATDRTLFGDVDGDGVDEIIQFNRRATADAALSGAAFRTVDIATGATEHSFNYADAIGTLPYSSWLDELVDPEDEVFVGHFTQNAHLEALFFNRTNQNMDAVALRAIDLVTGEITFTSLHDDNIFGGWMDVTDEYIVSDTNYDGYDDLVMINRVEDPTSLRNTNTGFVGMVSIHALPGAPEGPYRGFYRFFDWNSAVENNLLPGYDASAGRTAAGRISTNGRSANGLVLVNNDSTEASAFAVLQPNAQVEGTRDSFQLVSTVFHNADNTGWFNAGNTYLMADFDGDGGDEVAVFNPSSEQDPVRVFGSTSGATLSTTSITLPPPTPDTIGSSQLSEFYVRYQQAVSQGPLMTAHAVENYGGLMQFNGDKVLVAVRSGSAAPNRLRAALSALGMADARSPMDLNLVQGYLPIAKLADLPNLPDFAGISPILGGRANAGIAEWQGDEVIGADQFRDDQNVDGTGVSIAVISDSVDQVDSNGDNVFGIAESQATGDLPAVGVTVVQDGGPTDTDEGRAMLEIIHDIAPGADLFFYSATQGSIDTAAGILTLGRGGVNIIVDDIGFFNEPFYNDGIVAQAIDDVVTNNGTIYLSAAGNAADHAYESAWRGAVGKAANRPGTFHDFDPGAGVDILQNFTLQAGGSVDLFFQWDEAFLDFGASPLPNYRVDNDLDIFVTDTSGTVVFAQSVDSNRITNMALEFITFTNLVGFGTTEYAIAIRQSAGRAPTRIKWITPSVDIQAQGQGASTVFGHQAARNNISIGAVPFFNPTVPEDFSAFGPGTILFDDDGVRLAAPEIRNQPLFVAPDNGNTSFFGFDIPEDADTLPNFPGTSAAAPTAAAAIALLLDDDPTLTRDQIIQRLKDTAVDLGTQGYDNITGFGLIQLRPGVAQPPLPPGPGVGNPGPPDQFELNQTADRATDLGTIAPGVTIIDPLTIHSGTDVDWYRFNVDADTDLLITMEMALDAGDLDLQLYAFDTGSNRLILLDLGTQRQSNGTETVGAQIAAGTIVYVRANGYNKNVGGYKLTITA